ncbi:MAG: POTRA domain-containing protein [Terriglobia bacterium]
MRGQLTCSSVFFLTLLLCPPASAEDGFSIQLLQVRGSARPVELETHAGQTLDRARIARDIRRLWATGWFEDVRVEAALAAEGLHVVFTVAEKPRLYLRRVEFEPADEQRPLGVKSGRPVDALFSHQVAAALRRQLLEEGYAEADVAAELIPVGFQEADLLLRVEPGRRYRVEQVRFSGNPGMEPKELKRALRATRGRRLLPGFPGLWKGWVLRPPFSELRVEADLGRLHSLYLSRGYFQAQVGLSEVEIAGDKATLTIGVESGRGYHVRETWVRGAEPAEELEPRVGGEVPAGELCHCLREARRRSDGDGRLDFAVQLEIEAADEPPWAFLANWARQAPSERREEAAAGNTPSHEKWVALTARIASGPAYTVGRIEFRGHHSFSDLTLRRALRLQEGELFDRAQLRLSLARLNRLGFLESVREDDVRLFRDPEGRRVHVVLTVREKKRGRWSLSGPLGPLSLTGPLQFALSSRLPAWGRGPLELSTYNATFGLLAFSQPALFGLGLLPKTLLLPVFALERPFLPGQGWQSGFLLSPQLGWRGTLAHYGFTQARQGARAALRSHLADPVGLTIPVWWGPDEEDGATARRFAGVLRCDASRPRWAWLRKAGTAALDFVLAPKPF